MRRTHPVHTLPKYFFKIHPNRFQSVIYQSACHRHTDSVVKKEHNSSSMPMWRRTSRNLILTPLPLQYSIACSRSAGCFEGSGLLLRNVAPWTHLDSVILIAGFSLCTKSDIHPYVKLLGRRSIVPFTTGGKFYTRTARVKEVLDTTVYARWRNLRAYHFLVCDAV